MANETIDSFAPIGVEVLTTGEKRVPSQAVSEEKPFGKALHDRQPEIKHIDAQGNFVEEADASAAHVVNMNDPDAHNFIERIKAQAKDVKPKESGVVHSTAADVTHEAPAAVEPERKWDKAESEPAEPKKTVSKNTR